MENNVEPDAHVDGLARSTLAAAIEVHRQLGPGYVESVYDEAMAIELALSGITFTRQVVVPVRYKGSPVGQGRLDILVGNALVVELKAIEAVSPVHKAQLLSYLKATGHRLGLLINFNVPVLLRGVHRVLLSKI
jgi:GxxExxY protein